MSISEGDGGLLTTLASDVAPSDVQPSRFRESTFVASSRRTRMATTYRTPFSRFLARNRHALVRRWSHHLHARTHLGKPERSGEMVRTTCESDSRRVRGWGRDGPRTREAHALLALPRGQECLAKAQNVERPRRCHFVFGGTNRVARVQNRWPHSGERQRLRGAMCPIALSRLAFASEGLGGGYTNTNGRAASTCCRPHIVTHKRRTCIFEAVGLVSRRWHQLRPRRVRDKQYLAWPPQACSYR